MAWDAGTITNASPWATLSGKVQTLISGGSGIANWSFVKNIPAGTGAGQSGSTLYSLDLYRCRGATNLYKRAVQINLVNTQNTTDATSFTFTTSATPAASRFFTIFVANTKASAADDPTSITLSGSNAPTFTQIKSQAGGNVGEIKGTLWLGKSSGSAPTGTTLTVNFGATQTSCIVIMDQWDGEDLTLGADGVDATGATKIGIQVVGANGTTDTVQTVTLGAMLGAQSIGVMWAAETASSGTYTNKAGWTGVAISVTNAGGPNIAARGQWRNDNLDVFPQLTISSNLSQTSWCGIAFEFQRTTQSTSITNANDAGKDWYFVIEIPIPDGAVNSSINALEDYDGNELFRKPCSALVTATPEQVEFTSSSTLTSYNNVPNNNRGTFIHQSLTTSTFNYWIKITPNLIWIATRVGAAERASGAMLMDSFVTNTTDMPLMCFTAQTSASSGGATFSRLPGVTASVTSGWAATCIPWTLACYEAFTTNASAQQDFWAGGKVHASRVFVSHSAGRTAGNSGANNWGYARGLWKSDLLCIRPGGVISIGDTMTIAGNTWTCVGAGASNIFYGGTGSLSMIVFARAN